MSMLFLLGVLFAPPSVVCEPQSVWHSPDYVWQNVASCGCHDMATRDALILAEEEAERACFFHAWQAMPTCEEDVAHPNAYSCCCIAIIHCPLEGVPQS